MIVSIAACKRRRKILLPKQCERKKYSRKSLEPLRKILTPPPKRQQVLRLQRLPPTTRPRRSRRQRQLRINRRRLLSSLSLRPLRPRPTTAEPLSLRPKRTALNLELLPRLASSPRVQLCLVVDEVQVGQYNSVNSRLCPGTDPIQASFFISY